MQEPPGTKLSELLLKRYLSNAEQVCLLSCLCLRPLGLPGGMWADRHTHCPCRLLGCRSLRTSAKTSHGCSGAHVCHATWVLAACRRGAARVHMHMHTHMCVCVPRRWTTQEHAHTYTCVCAPRSFTRQGHCWASPTAAAQSPAKPDAAAHLDCSVRCVLCLPQCRQQHHGAAPVGAGDI